MGIFQRISDIVSANLNELTEGFENPEPMLKQAICEMEASIIGATRETAKALANEKTIGKELQSNQAQVQKWHDRAATAVAAGDDALARKALKRQHEHEKLVEALQEQKEIACETGQSLRRQLEAMKAKLAEAKRSLATLSARQRAADFRKKMQSVQTDVSSELHRDAFAKFDRLRNKVERAEAEAEAYADLNVTQRDDFELDEQFETSNDDEIDARLAELKVKANA